MNTPIRRNTVRKLIRGSCFSMFRTMAKESRTYKSLMIAAISHEIRKEISTLSASAKSDDSMFSAKKSCLQNFSWEKTVEGFATEPSNLTGSPHPDCCFLTFTTCAGIRQGQANALHGCMYVLETEDPQTVSFAKLHLNSSLCQQLYQTGLFICILLHLYNLCYRGSVFYNCLGVFQLTATDDMPDTPWNLEHHRLFVRRF